MGGSESTPASHAQVCMQPDAFSQLVTLCIQAVYQGDALRKAMSSESQAQSQELWDTGS